MASSKRGQYNIFQLRSSHTYTQIIQSLALPFNNQYIWPTIEAYNNEGGVLCAEFIPLSALK